MKFNPLDGNRAAINYNNKLERNASEKRWDAFYKGRQDARNHKSFSTYNYTNEDEINMYKIGWESIKKKQFKRRKSK
jgi:hypothetical protein